MCVLQKRPLNHVGFTQPLAQEHSGGSTRSAGREQMRQTWVAMSADNFSTGSVHSASRDACLRHVSTVLKPVYRFQSFDSDYPMRKWHQHLDQNCPDILEGRSERFANPKALPVTDSCEPSPPWSRNAVMNVPSDLSEGDSSDEECDIVQKDKEDKEDKAASSSRGHDPPIDTAKFKSDEKFSIHWLAVSLRNLEAVRNECIRADLDEMRDHHIEPWQERSLEVLKMLLSSRCEDFLQSFHQNNATRRDFLATLRNGLSFMRPEHHDRVQQFLARLNVDLDRDSDKRSFASKSFVDNLINEARAQASVWNPRHQLSEKEHDIALKHVKGIFQTEYITNKDLEQTIQKVDKKNKSLGRNKKDVIRKRRRDAFRQWIKTLTGDAQLFHCQLRFGVMGVKDRDALAKALILTRGEVRSSLAQCKPNEVPERQQTGAMTIQQACKRARNTELENRFREQPRYSMYHIAAKRAFEHTQAEPPRSSRKAVLKAPNDISKDTAPTKSAPQRCSKTVQTCFR